jgi:hypothetical protein
MSMRSTIFVVAAISGVMTSSALAQSKGEAALFSQGHFKGYSMTISGPTRSIDAFAVKSIRISAGSAWDLCTGDTFTGCSRFTQSRAAMVMTVRSARPVAPPIPATATTTSGPVKASGGSLRGLASEFFVTPEEGGNRVEVDVAAGALPRRATEFCRAHGWRTSAYERDQAIGNRRYLADVLCTDDSR